MLTETAVKAKESFFPAYSKILLQNSSRMLWALNGEVGRVLPESQDIWATRVGVDRLKTANTEISVQNYILLSVTLETVVLSWGRHIAHDYLGSMKIFPIPSCTMAYLQQVRDVEMNSAKEHLVPKWLLCETGAAFKILISWCVL